MYHVPGRLKCSVVGTMRFLLLCCLVIVSQLLVATGQNFSFNENSSWELCECKKPPCSCVVYYLCGQDGVILTTGMELVDERFGAVKTCPMGQVCCRNPEGVAGPSEPGAVEPLPPTPAPKPPTSAPRPPSPKPTPKPPVLSNRPGLSRICGVRGTAFLLEENWARIGGSNDADQGTVFAEFPWMVAILRRDNTNALICGASLIHERVILTAAHCVKRWKAEDLIIRAGEWNTTDDEEIWPHQDRFVKQIIKHPQFNEGTLFNDIALLVADQPFEEAINVAIICLPEPEARFNSRRCLATGWGRDVFGKKGQLHATLKKVDLPIIEHAFCQERLRKTRLGIYFILNKSFMCAGGEPEKDTCQGDGGGPLICQSNVDPERYIQAGIVSWGIGCKESLTPAVYANVAALRPWIDKEVSALNVEVVTQA